jgi:hypothetical protein
MKRRDKKIRRQVRALVALVLAAGASRAPAQMIYHDDMVLPEFTLPHLRYINMDSEYEQNSYAPKSGPGGVNTQRTYLSPTAGIAWNYFIYHPALFTFDILAEPGYVWQSYSGSSSLGGSSSVLLNGDFTGQLLREKAYATTLDYNRSHNDYHYDFFNSATVDTQTWGASSGYRDGPVPVTISFSKSDSDSTGLSQTTKTDQLGVQVHARNKRKSLDATDLTYQFNDLRYDTTYNTSAYSTENSFHLVNLTDAEHYQHSTLNSSLRYYEIESPSVSSSEVDASVGFNVDHTPHLRSFYSDNFTYYTGNGADSIQDYATAGISHQLFESLASSANIHGSVLDSTYSGAKYNSQTIGLGESEDYTKHLGDWGNLSLGNNINYDLNFQQADASSLFIANESYTLPTTGPLIIRLKTARDLAISSILKNGVSLDPAEWSAITSTDPWQVQFFTGGPNHLQPGDVVTISYTATSNPSGNYNVFSDDAHINLRFWHDRAEVYARYSVVQNAANSDEFLLQNFNEFEAGGDVLWNGFHAQGSWLDHRSTLYDYQSLGFSEGYAHPLTLHSSVGIDLSQQWNRYPAGSGTSTNSAQTGTFYNFMAHYDWTPAANFNWHLETGWQTQSGLGYDENLFAVRTYFNWTLGKLEIHLGYEHDNQIYTAEKRDRDFAFIRMRRNF